MSHVDWFERFFEERIKGTAQNICNFLIKHEVKFKCVDSRRITSVSSHLNKLTKANLHSRQLCREKNVDNVWEYYLA